MSVLFQANFVAADGTSASSISQSPYSNWTTYSGTNMRILTNRAHRLNGTSNANLRTNEGAGFSTADYTVKATLRRVGAGGSGNDAFRLYARGDGTVSNCYRLVWFGGTLTLASVSGGTPSTIGTSSALSSPTLNQDYVVELVCNGSSISCKLDGSTIIGPTTNTVHTTASHAGFASEGATGDASTTTGFHFGAFVVEDFVTAGGNAPRSQFYHLQGMR